MAGKSKAGAEGVVGLTHHSPLTMHEKECALAAIGALLEKATSTRERRDLRIWLKGIIDAPLEDERLK